VLVGIGGGEEQGVTAVPPGQQPGEPHDKQPEPEQPAPRQPFESVFTKVNAALHESWLPKEHPLYRPRHAHQRLARICALIFFVAPLTALAVFGQPPAIENHAVHGFPSLSQGWGFFTGLLPWATDNLPFRQGAIKVADGISRGLFGEPAPLGEGSDQPAGPLPAAPTTTTAPAAPSVPLDQTSDGYPEVIEGTDGWLYFGYDMQGKCEPAQSLTTIVTNLDRLKAAVEQSGRTFILFVAPDKSSIEPEHLPATYAGKSCASAVDKKFWQQMDLTVGAVDPRPELQAAAAQSGQSVYFPQDTHWNYTGGLIMTRELAERIQPTVSATWRVTPGKRLSGPADLPAMLAQTGTNTSTEYNLAPDGTIDRTHPVASDAQTPLTVHSDFPVTGMVTARTTMIDDSFAQYASPLFPATFADLTTVSPEIAAGDPAAEAARMVSSKVVVVEVVERNLVAGVSPVTNPQFVATVAAELKAHPTH
jgi:alginate O-acetyltransferase complex protein AlgJ